jgi:diketogulonate reductase-like aldo/keto reductase
LEYKEFGKSKFKVSAIGMGTYYDVMSIIGSKTVRYYRGKGEKTAALRKGIEMGINLIDTAEIYCTEDLVGDAVKNFKRDELFIATKVWPSHLRYDDLLAAADRSLKKLRCSYIDLYQIHWPSSRVPITETMKAMEKLIDEGKVRYVGVSNFSLPQMIEAQEALSKYDLVSSQVEYNLLVRDVEKGLLQYCNNNDIAILAYRPIAHGALSKPRGSLRKEMEAISKEHGGKSPAQIALNWLLSRSRMIFPIPRASKPARVIENVGGVGWTLSQEEVLRLMEAVNKV